MASLAGLGSPFQTLKQQKAKSAAKERAASTRQGGVFGSRIARTMYGMCVILLGFDVDV